MATAKVHIYLYARTSNNDHGSHKHNDPTDGDLGITHLYLAQRARM